MFFNKKIYNCKVMDRYKIDIDRLLSNNDKSIELVAENDKYCFYVYSESSFWRYLLRQNKTKRKEVVSLGDIGWDSIFCIWDNYLVSAMSGKAELNVRDSFTFIDVETGIRRYEKLRSKYGNMLFVRGYGRQNNQDIIKKMYVEDGNLIIEFQREKYDGNDAEESHYYKDMDYTLVCQNNNGSLLLYRSYEDDKE